MYSFLIDSVFYYIVLFHSLLLDKRCVCCVFSIYVLRVRARALFLAFSLPLARSRAFLAFSLSSLLSFAVEYFLLFSGFGVGGFVDSLPVFGDHALWRFQLTGNVQPGFDS